ncbi:OmpA family protein [Vibrio sp. PNB22_3_1]
MKQFKGFLCLGVFLVSVSWCASAYELKKNVTSYDSNFYLAKQARILEENMRQFEVELHKDRVRIVVPGIDGFSVGQSNLTRPVRDELDRLAEYLKYFNDSSIEVVGHVDQQEFDAGFHELGMERAIAVQDRLYGHGIAVPRVVAFSEQSEVLRCEGKGDLIRQCNRRVEIDILLDPELYR